MGRSKYQRVMVSVTPVGTAGSAEAVGTSTGLPYGRVVGLAVDYVTAPDTTRVYVDVYGVNGLARRLWAQVGGNTSFTGVPLLQAVTVANVAIAASYEPLPCFGGYYTVDVQVSDPTSTVIVALLIES